MSREYLPGKNSKRRSAMLVMCPTCGALAKRPCIGTRSNIRVALHADRYAKAAEQTPA